MKHQCVFKCPITKYYIEFIIDTELCVAYIGTIGCDYVHIKPFMGLLRNSIDLIIKKNIEKIRQSVDYNEWKLYLENKTTWKIINDNKIDHIYEIECDICDFLQNYGVGIGLLQ